MAVAPLALGESMRARLPRSAGLPLLLALSGVAWLLFQGAGLMTFDEGNELFKRITIAKDWLSANRLTMPVFVYFFNPIRAVIDGLVVGLGWALGAISWIGLTALFAAAALIFVSLETGLLVLVAFLAFGALGLWAATVSTLALVGAAVIFSLVVGIPLGILAGRSDRFQRVITPVLDVMQIMPTFAYLAPLVLLFMIGPATAAIATMIYSIPPAVRITSLGIRGVPAQTVEAAESMGSTSIQILRDVQLPMARTTIGLAVNQTIMMALSMVVIAALVGAGGLGQKIVFAISTMDVGQSFDAGLAIVLLAMVLDRLTAAASKERDRRERGHWPPARVPRRLFLGSILGATAVLVVVGQLLPFGAEFPKAIAFSFADPVNGLTDWLSKNASALTGSIKDGITFALINPLETLLVNSPWWLTIGFAGLAALLVSGRRAGAYVAICLIAILALGVWEHAMQTTAQVVAAAVITMAFGVTAGVLAARSDTFSRVIRPINDAAQTMPSFVYLLPAVVLFGPGRFTAILAAVIYAFPAVVRLVEDGVRGVPATVIEAATSAGSSRLQMILKVQLPMASRSLLVAANQGVILVLAMVVVGGLVGAGALGHDVVAGFSQSRKFGMGFAAALALVLLGIALDRVTQGVGAKERSRSS